MSGTHVKGGAGTGRQGGEDGDKWKDGEDGGKSDSVVKENQR